MKKLDESLLTDLPPFRRLTRPHIREILDAATALLFDAESRCSAKANRWSGLSAARRPYRVIRTTPGGDQIIALHIAPGQLFGIGAALGRTTYPATAMTADDCLALSWPNRLWTVFTERYQGLRPKPTRLLANGWAR